MKAQGINVALPAFIQGRRSNVIHKPKLLPTLVRAGNEEKPNFGDELLDFMYAGKKLRKWYGEEGMVLPKDGKLPEDQQPDQQDMQDDYSGPRDHILVFDIDSSPMAEQVLLQLILARAPIKVVAKDAEAAKSGFGPYAEIIADGGGGNELMALTKALRNVGAVVVCGKLTPQMIDTLRTSIIPRVVLLSSVGTAAKGFFLFGGGGETAVLSDAKREESALASGLPVTIVRVGSLLDVPGGDGSIQIVVGKGLTGGDVSREDAASVLSEMALIHAKGQTSRESIVCSVSSGGDGGRDVGEVVASLLKQSK